jgi:hypothetical protein
MIEVREAQLWKAWSEISVMLDGMVMVVRFGMPENAKLPVVVTVLGMIS